jgi:squalene cyclase
MPTDASEKGLETLIVESLTSEAGYVQGSNADNSREHVIDLAKLRAFLEATQPETAAALTELFKQFSDNPDFKKWLADTIFAATYDEVV